ncbi:glycosyltransferase [Pontibacter oryzae]|uniref:Glycosyltransferase n=2 Tax=Pontibacter oryzae TaxID=2304593 RepID=A0A399SGB8_9BACT|nr:glycosyltransferase [Pontibacter oryzae]
MTLYLLVFAVAGHFPRRRVRGGAPRTRFLVLIPAYREDGVILHTAREALKQVYPQELYRVAVIADSLQPETILKLRELPIETVEVQFEISTKSKSINAALKTITGTFDHTLVLDADNVMAPDFLAQMDVYAQQGEQAIQGHRVAKNQNTGFAVLDGLSEEINNHIFREGHRALGLSAALIGSGMSFSYDYFRDLMHSIEAVGGFDKELELKLLRNGTRIAYATEAYVYDEKVQQAEVFGNQRRRWLSAQFHYLGAYFTSGVYHLLAKGNVDYMDKIVQFVLLPRVILSGLILLLAFLSGALHVVAGYAMYPGTAFWGGLLLGNVAAMLLSVPKKFYRLQTLKAVLHLPKAFLIFLLTIFRLKGANKRFIHTPHTTNDIK